MMDEKVLESLEKEDVVICIRPTVLNGNEWSGDVNISVLAGRDNPLHDDDYYSLLHFAKMVCATVPMMETSPDLRNIAHDYVMTEVDNQELEIDFEPESNRGKVLDRKDNVVTLSFGSKTKGSA